jgi:hypothetical protein
MVIDGGGRKWVMKKRMKRVEEDERVAYFETHQWFTNHGWEDI